MGGRVVGWVGGWVGWVTARSAAAWAGLLATCRGLTGIVAVEQLGGGMEVQEGVLQAEA